jgi:2C-methyl-D-erythritol 2,4-cyclodiphosphate synthase
MVDEWRIGIGSDLHHAAGGRPLILGGFEIRNDFGLIGHQDGDVVLHAVIDALFGAAGLPDMSERFPENLQQLSHTLGLPVDQLHEHGITATSGQEGAERTIGDLTSTDMLAQALEEIRAGHWAINNVDVTILAKRPNLSKHKLSIKKSLADLLALDWERVSIKSSAHSGIGTVEQGRAIACEAAVTLRATETHG